MTILFVIIWLGFGFFGCGFLYASLQRELSEFAQEDRRQDSVVSLIMALTGPFALLQAWCQHFKHGWLCPFMKDEQRHEQD